MSTREPQLLRHSFHWNKLEKWALINTSITVASFSVYSPLTGVFLWRWPWQTLLQVSYSSTSSQFIHLLTANLRPPTLIHFIKLFFLQHFISMPWVHLFINLYFYAVYLFINIYFFPWYKHWKEWCVQTSKTLSLAKCVFVYIYIHIIYCNSTKPLQWLTESHTQIKTENFRQLNFHYNNITKNCGTI